jgi:hypothetical protein
MLNAAACRSIIHVGNLIKKQRIQSRLSITLINNYLILKLDVKRIRFVVLLRRRKADK